MLNKTCTGQILPKSHSSQCLPIWRIEKDAGKQTHQVQGLLILDTRHLSL